MLLTTVSDNSLIPSAAAVAPTLNTITKNPVDSRVVTLTWSVVADTTVYNVYRDTIFISNIIGMAPYNTSVVPTFSETINQAGTFYYVVTDVVGGVESAISNCQSVVVTVDPLEAPTVQLLNTLPVQLSWDMIDRATQYYIYKSTSPITSIESMSPYQTNPYVLPFFQETVSNNGTYYYAVAATDGFTNSSINGYVTAVVSVPPIETPVITSADVNNNLGTITVNWNQISGVQSYRVYFSTAAITDGNVGSLTPISTINTEYITTTTIQNSTDGNYYVAVVAAYGSVISAVSVNAPVTIAMVPLSTPVLQGSASSSGYVELNWTNVENAAYYEVYQNEGSSVPELTSSYLATVAFTNQTTIQVTVDGDYYFVVKAILNSLSSVSNEISVSVMILLGYRQSLTLSIDTTNTNTYGQTVLSWSRINNATNIFLYRESYYFPEAPEGLTPYMTLPGNLFTYIDSSFDSGAYYCYAVRAYFSGDLMNTTSSNSVVVTVAITPLSTCTLNPIDSDNGKTGRIILSWSTVPRATTYDVYRWSILDSTNRSIVTVPITNYVDIVSENDTYTYQVVARLATLFSSSNTESIVVNILPDTETSVTLSVQSASNSTGNIVLTWTFLTSASTYSIFRQKDTPITSIGGLSAIATLAQPLVAYTDQLLTNGTYYYRVVPSFNTVAGTLSNEVSVNVGIEPLTPVTLRPLQHINADGRILLNWTTNTRYTSYKIYSSTTGPISDVTGLTAIYTAYTGTYTHQVYDDELTYYYVVVAYLSALAAPMSNCESIYVEIASLANTTVYDITPNPNTLDGRNLIRWNRITRAQTYNVLRSTSPITSATGIGVISIANITSSYTTSYTDQILITNTYYYAVVGMIGPIYGNLSNYVSVNVNIAPLEAPILQLITPNPDYDGTITLKWNTSARADRYLIYRDIVPISDSYIKSPIGQSTSGSFYESGLGTGTYYYAVRAVLGTVSPMYSLMSNCQSVVVSNDLPDAPILALITENSKTNSANISLVWTYSSVVTANAFLIYRQSTPFTSKDGLTPFATVNGSTFSKLITLNSTGTFYFAVAGQNPAGIGALSAVRQIEYQNNFAPEVTSPTDITFVVNSTGNVISWSVLDINTSVDATYTIYQNGTSVATGTWSSGNMINFTIDYLDVGSYEFKLVLSDGFTGEWALTAEDIVLVTVTPRASSTDYTMYMIIGGVAVGVIGIVGFLSKKKKVIPSNTGDAGEITF